jgi:hypothetical protein
LFALFAVVGACTNGSEGPAGETGKGGSGAGNGGSGGSSAAGNGGAGGSSAGNGGAGGSSAGNGGAGGSSAGGAGGSSAGGAGGEVDAGPVDPCPPTRPDPGSSCYAPDYPGGLCPSGGKTYPNGDGCVCVMATGFGQWMCFPMGGNDDAGTTTDDAGSTGEPDARPDAGTPTDTRTDTRFFDARFDTRG